MFAEFNVLMDTIDLDTGLKVVVFESANPNYFIAHYDLERGEVPDQPGAAEFSAWPKFVARLAQSRVISVAKLRGRARGQGSEVALACDMRFASKEKAVLSQLEVGGGVVPGGGATEWLCALVGRSRALEIICDSNDLDADTAEKYGWVNRSIPDAELDAFVDDFARRIASFERRPLELAKKLINGSCRRAIGSGLPGLQSCVRQHDLLAGDPGAHRKAHRQGSTEGRRCRASARSPHRSRLPLTWRPQKLRFEPQPSRASTVAPSHGSGRHFYRVKGGKLMHLEFRRVRISRGSLRLGTGRAIAPRGQVMVVADLAGGQRVRISCKRGGERQAQAIAAGLDHIHCLTRDPQPIGQFFAWLQPRSAPERPQADLHQSRIITTAAWGSQAARIGKAQLSEAVGCPRCWK